jgi:hypothetical protein
VPPGPEGVSRPTSDQGEVTQRDPTVLEIASIVRPNRSSGLPVTSYHGTPLPRGRFEAADSLRRRHTGADDRRPSICPMACVIPSCMPISSIVCIWAASMKWVTAVMRVPPSIASKVT